MLRIVPLIASATEIVHALGLGAFQVGRSHECDYPAEVASLPVCTTPRFEIEGNSEEIDLRVKASLRDAQSVYEVFSSVLEGLEPTHIITQTQCAVCAVSLEDVERAMSQAYSTQPKIVALEPNSLADIWADIWRVAVACGIEADGERLIAVLKNRMSDIVRKARAAGSKPRVACIEWHQPLMAAGNWVPELVEMLGAVNLFGEAGRHSPWMTWEDLAASEPNIILTMPCGFDLARTRAEMYWLEQNPLWPRLRAVQNGEVYLLDGNQYMNRPGPRVVESLQILAEILYPRHFEPQLNGSAWQKA
jgi:iron complex transport system substrate-binding protein